MRESTVRDARVVPKAVCENFRQRVLMSDRYLFALLFRPQRLTSMKPNCTQPLPGLLALRRRLSLLWLLVCSGLMFGPCLLPSHGWAQTTEASPEDAAAKQMLTEMLHDYVARFNSRDFDALGTLLDHEVTYRDDSTHITGSAALIEGLRKVTRDEPSVKLSIEVQDVKRDGEVIAFAEGIASMVSDQTPSESNRFEVKFGKSADAWKIVSITETSGTFTSSDALQSLTWLIGSWQDSNDPTLTTTVRFVPGNQFLQRLVERRTDTETVQVATEMIGYDPNSHQVRSWLFFADGSFGSGKWQGESDHCKIHMQQTLVDGG